jgi:F-type H+-transporting ATPase subunit a
MTSPLDSTVLFQIGPIQISQAIVTTWAIIGILVVGAFLLTRRLDLRPTQRQAALELLVTTLDTQITAGSSARSFFSFSWQIGPHSCPGLIPRPQCLKPMPL